MGLFIKVRALQELIIPKFQNFKILNINLGYMKDGMRHGYGV